MVLALGGALAFCLTRPHLWRGTFWADRALVALARDEAPTDMHVDDRTGSFGYVYALSIFTDPMISDWHGRWGEELIVKGDGPPGPAYKTTAYYVWYDPKEFSNYYRKRESYPYGDWSHPETWIP